MFEYHLDAGIFLSKVLRQLFSKIDRTVLSSCATEADRKVGKMTLQIVVNGLVHYGKDMFPEFVYFRTVLKILGDTFVASCI